MKKIKYLNKKKKQKKTFFTKVSTNEFLDFIVKKKIDYILMMHLIT